MLCYGYGIGAGLIVLLATIAVPANGQEDVTAVPRGRGAATGHRRSRRKSWKPFSRRAAPGLNARHAPGVAMSNTRARPNVAPKPGVPMSAYVSDVGEMGSLMHGETRAPLVLYCNGPHCGKSKRLTEELRKCGYSNIRTLPVGDPFLARRRRSVRDELQWAPAHARQRTATVGVIDAREAADSGGSTVPGAGDSPRSLVLDAKDKGGVKLAKDDRAAPDGGP